MSKWSGKIGFSTMVEVEPSQYEMTIIERPYKGEYIRNRIRHVNNSTVNGDVSVSNDISIVADPFLTHKASDMAYITFMGQLWCVADIDATTRPRINVSLGGKYNGPTADNSSTSST